MTALDWATVTIISIVVSVAVELVFHWRTWSAIICTLFRN